MIKTIDDITEHLNWLDGFLCDESFSSPFCDRKRIISASSKENNILLGAYKDETLAGIFCLMVLDDEKYIETIFLYCKESESYGELMDYLAENYCGYEAWFVFNPKNCVLRERLLDRKAFFYTEQRYMDYQGEILRDGEEIIPYCEGYKDEYIAIHSDDGYWNGQNVVEKIDDFDVFLCVRDGQLVGYIDISKGKVPEIMDIRIIPEYRNQGIGALLLRKAISFVNGRRLILTVDVDNDAANHLYEKIGFKEIALNNCMTAKFVIKESDGEHL